MLKRKPYLFEISWEVCNMMGGIYTVISSKLDEAMKNFSNYYLVGVYNGQDETVFLEEKIPEKFAKKRKELEDMGITIHFGKWNIKNKPNVILVEHLGYSDHTNDIKGKIWEVGQVDSMGTQWHDYDGVILWSWVCGVVIEKLTEDLNEKILVHAHEWMSGGAIFYLKSFPNYKYQTIFTTHATMLGRAISGSGKNLTELKDQINPDEYAYSQSVHTKHQTEKALANISDCFTTVSQTTANETEIFFDKKPDVILYNGFDTKSVNNIQNEANLSRNDIDDFLTGYFHDFCEYNPEKTKIFFTSGRNEYRNKGVDLFINALSKLNNTLNESNSDHQIVALFLIPIGEFEINHEVENSIKANLLNKSAKLESTNVPLSTHIVPWENEIINGFTSNNLNNKCEDKVKVILIPEYIDRKEQIFHKTYYEFVIGLDLGVFPSQYEPWGYTPLESISYGIPTVTSDLAGFGRYTQREFKEGCGVNIIKRENSLFEESSEQLAQTLLRYTTMNSKDFENEKKCARKFSQNFDWKNFYKNYLQAYNFSKYKQ